MSKAASSFYDWELSIRGTERANSKKKNQEDKKIQNEEKSEKNSLGISKEEFQNYLKEWKKKNL
ncbi:MAG: hypothetical protein EU541_02670 [Promethearchaeota archaeon]|nr:MAG: hypothetical protein EU541_02670 [Candidatus Lokiarchaeota archaeon]